MAERRPEVYVAGIGQTDVGELWNVSLRDLAVQAVQAAQKDAGGLKPQAVYVGNMLAASAAHQANLGALICEYANLSGSEGITAEAADASGGAALHLAYNAIRSGMVDIALAIGVEKATDVLGSNIDSLSVRNLDADYEASEGQTPIGQAALLMQRYLYENQFPREALAAFPMLAHSNAVSNPHAMYPKPIKLENYLKSSLLVEPFNLYDIAPLADGAAAVLLTRRELIPLDLEHPLVKIAGSSLVVDRLALHDRADPLFFEAAAVSVFRACQKAGISVADVDFFEYSDITTLHALLSLEAAGFAPRGQGWKLATDGSLTLDGSLPVATLGGHKARGNPLGAAGVYQAVEACLQLRGEAGKSQVPQAHIGMIQSLAGTGSTAVTHILERASQ
ncbi:MAG: beta-ketoacyl synthase N-terminal-like domain-containing protein [Anaerolineaceae bacterium]